MRPGRLRSRFEVFTPAYLDSFDHVSLGNVDDHQTLSPVNTMPDSPPSPLARYVQRTIDTTKIPFRAIGYFCTPVIHTVRPTWHLLRQICRQNWSLLCIFYLHLWQLFEDLPPVRPLTRHWKLIVAVLLFAGCTVPAALILHASVPLFRAYWEDGKHKNRARIIQHLAFFVFTCAPACAVLSTAATAACFVWKQKRHGKYQASMRKLGKGYWADPRDVED